MGTKGVIDIFCLWLGISITASEKNSFSEIERLDELSDSQRKDIAQLCSWRHYSNNEQVIDRQSDATNILFIVEGRLRFVMY